jgi:BspA type Leucine rich repeat region (6 copies)
LECLTISDGVTVIPANAFGACYSLTNLILPNSVTQIGNEAFDWCGFTNITLSTNLTSIGDLAFAYDDLTSISIPFGVTNIGQGAFECSSLTTATIPGSAGIIATDTFYNCYYLTTVTIGDGIKSIEDEAFDDSYSLTRAIIPASVTNIGDSAFYDCYSLTAVYFLGNAPTLALFVFCYDWDGYWYYDGYLTAYFLSGTTGWQDFPASTYLSTKLWNPQPQTSGGSLGVRTNRFGFNIIGTANIPIAVEACTSLRGGTWTPLQTCTLTNGSIYFSDPDWTNYPSRFYRIRSP